MKNIFAYNKIIEKNDYLKINFINIFYCRFFRLILFKFELSKLFFVLFIQLSRILEFLRDRTMDVELMYVDKITPNLLL